MTQLLDRWRAAITGVGATADEAAVTAAGVALLGRWSEPHRHYHDLSHLEAVLSVVDAHAHVATAPDRVRLAAWWHDAVYDPRATGDANERASAALAERTLLTLGAPPQTAAEVARLVLLTAGHEVGRDDPDGALLCDADLAILAAAPHVYDQYAAAIRREYAHVPPADFRRGRAAVLRHLLNLPALYRIPRLAEAWEGSARANLARELATLEDSSAEHGDAPQDAVAPGDTAASAHG
ncbi:MAG TPA: metal-dependent phosphohydrolase [Micromonospora sp.]|jgi:predicted metal-dependent HD superfamily phosphohydrolase